MKPNRIILIRHGESEGNVNRELYETIPDHRLKLTERGKQQAAQAGAKIREIIGKESVHIYTSPYTRTRETLQAMLSSENFNITKSFEDFSLREQDWGHLRSTAETERIQKERYAYGPFYYRFPNGESGADVCDRIDGFVGTLYRDFESDTYANNTLIVTHGLTIRLFLMNWFHRSPEEFETWDNPGNCEFFVMRLNPGASRYSMPDIRKTS